MVLHNISSKERKRERKREGEIRKQQLHSGASEFFVWFWKDSWCTTYSPLLHHFVPCRHINGGPGAWYGECMLKWGGGVWWDSLQKVSQNIFHLSPGRLPDHLWVSLDFCQVYNSCKSDESQPKQTEKWGIKSSVGNWHCIHPWISYMLSGSSLEIPHYSISPLLACPCCQLFSACRASRGWWHAHHVSHHLWQWPAVWESSQALTSYVFPQPHPPYLHKMLKAALLLPKVAF